MKHTIQSTKRFTVNNAPFLLVSGLQTLIHCRCISWFQSFQLQFSLEYTQTHKHISLCIAYQRTISRARSIFIKYFVCAITQKTWINLSLWLMTYKCVYDAFPFDLKFCTAWYYVLLLFLFCRCECSLCSFATRMPWNI